MLKLARDTVVKKAGFDPTLGTTTTDKASNMEKAMRVTNLNLINNEDM